MLERLSRTLRALFGLCNLFFCFPSTVESGSLRIKTVINIRSNDALLSSKPAVKLWVILCMSFSAEPLHCCSPVLRAFSNRPTWLNTLHGVWVPAVVSRSLSSFKIQTFGAKSDEYSNSPAVYLPVLVVALLFPSLRPDQSKKGFKQREIGSYNASGLHHSER